MCGIGGIVRFDEQPIADASLRAMLQQLRHRGPDGEGVLIDGPCGLVHTRLSIVDIEGGGQPMTLTDNRGNVALAVSYNGEIYNHRELRKHLEKAGHIFRTDHSDTEVLLHGYRAWGDDLPKRIEGMFAFAIWDAAQRRLTLCRDRTGQKPLYYRCTPRACTFGTLIGTVLAGMPSHARPTLDRAAMLRFLRLGYTGLDSMVEGVRELPPGHVVTIEAGQVSEPTQFWKPPEVSRTATSVGVLEATHELLREAVAQRLRADVPLGCFLSGGIDSSVVAAIGNKLLTEGGDAPLRTFSVRMPEAAYDESQFARIVADHLGTHHTELVAGSAATGLDDLARLIAIAGEPTADSSILPTFWVSQAAREHVKVALSGDGGDELFGGYDRYRAMRLLQKHRWWIARLPAGLFAGAQAKSMRTRLRRLIDAAQPERPAGQYLSMIHLFTDQQIRELGGPVPADSLNVSPEAPQWEDEPEPEHAAMRWDLQNYLPFDLLRKVDRASMAVALEVRIPLLHNPLVEFACHLPPSVLMPGGRPKALLRQIAAMYLPESITQRPKQGFAIPVGQWLANTWRDAVTDHLLHGHLDELGFERAPMERMIREHNSGHEDHTHRLFSLLTLSMWTSWVRDLPVAP
jgi:asparagine synthase (glutamine-hydrolysing)